MDGFAMTEKVRVWSDSHFTKGFARARAVLVMNIQRPPL
jgi:hypothetical protein